MKKNIFVLVICCLIVYYGYLFFSHREFFTRPFDYEKISQDYSTSQYVIGSGSTGIGDDGLYAFSGYYLIKGGDPSAVNFENPPLGKYLIGVSILLFTNENMIYILYALLILVTTYVFSNYLFKDGLLSILPVVLLSLSTLFIIQFIPTNLSQYSVTLLDLPVALFLLFSIYLFLKASNNKKYYFLSTFFMGLTFLTKFFPGLLFIVIILALYLWFEQRKHLKVWLFSLLLLPITYVIGYGMFFRYHPSFSGFIDFQKYVISWRLGNPVVVGNIFTTIFMGRYRSWWADGWIVDAEWHYSLPILVVLAGIGVIISFKKHDKKCILLSVLTIAFIVYLSLGSVGVARYLVPILPLIAIVAALPFKKVLGKLTKLS